MHPHEEATIRAFICPAKRKRWLEQLGSERRRRRKFLNRLNHCWDFDDRYAKLLPSNADVAAILKARGAPATCYVLSDTKYLDGREMPLEKAITDAELAGWGTIISCLPGSLAYYYGEIGECRLLLERKIPLKFPPKSAGTTS